MEASIRKGKRQRGGELGRQQGEEWVLMASGERCEKGEMRRRMRETGEVLGGAGGRA